MKEEVAPVIDASLTERSLMLSKYNDFMIFAREEVWIGKACGKGWLIKDERTEPQFDFKLWL